MNARALIPIGVAVLSVGLTACERDVSYTADIQPIMDNYCLSCHTTAGEGQAASGFAVTRNRTAPQRQPPVNFMTTSPSQWIRR